MGGWYRRFYSADSNDLRCSIGACELTGACTIAALIYRTADGVRDQFIATHSSGGILRADLGTGINPDQDHFLSCGTHSATIGPLVADAWCLCVMAREAGASVTSRFHIKKPGQAWVHEDARDAAGNRATAAGGTVRFADISGVAFTNLKIAVAGMWTTKLTDGQVELLSTSGTTQDWLDLSPAGCWEFGQTSVSMEIEDLTGNGADQTSIVGTEALYDPDLTWEYSRSYLPDVSPYLSSYVQTAGRGQ